MRAAVLLGLALLALGVGGFALAAARAGLATALGMAELFALPVMLGGLVLGLAWALGGR